MGPLLFVNLCLLVLIAWAKESPSSALLQRAIPRQLPFTHVRFHAEDKWPRCASVFRQIRNQGECNSCWALAPADVLRDRYCIRLLYGQEVPLKLVIGDAQRYIPNFSVGDVLSCCRLCYRPAGCTTGGRPQLAWSHFKLVGATVEDRAKSASEFSYMYPPCNHSLPANALRFIPRLSASGDEPVPPKLPYCQRASIVPPPCPPAAAQRKRVKISDTVVIRGSPDDPKDVEIMREIFEHGPVQATMVAFPVLASYPRGNATPLVYQCRMEVWLKKLRDNPNALENQRRSHSVRIVGWGTMQQAPPESPKSPASDTSKTSRTSTLGKRVGWSSSRRFTRPPGDFTPSREEEFFRRFQITNDDIAGPDSTGAVKYWIVANSWGSDWGDSGFFYVARGRQDCRISQAVIGPRW
jgi:hypothetical protein